MLGRLLRQYNLAAVVLLRAVVGRVVRNLDLAASSSRLYDCMLLLLRAIFHVGDLSRGLASSLPDSLDGRNDLLVFVVSLLMFRRLVDFEFDNSLLATIAAV